MRVYPRALGVLAVFLALSLTAIDPRTGAAGLLAAVVVNALVFLPWLSDRSS